MSGSVVGNTAFAAALTQVCTSLARQIVADGEGITHVVELHIEGAATDADALKIAKAIAHSPLVKTAWAGCDPNWGRLIAAVGYSGAVNRSRAHRHLVRQFCPSAASGGRAPGLRRSRRPRLSSRSPNSPSPSSSHQAPVACRFWTTDLTAEYVHINADYST